MKRVLGLAILLACPCFCHAQQITVPATITIDGPGLVIIRATSIDADSCRFFTIGKPRLQVIPEDILPVPAGVFIGVAPSVGTYKLGVVVAKTVNGKAVMSRPQGIDVIVGTPVPPVPPVPPTPPDPSLAVLQAAFDKEIDPEKLTQAKTLAGLYRTAAADTGYATVGAYFQAVNKSIAASLAPTVLAATKQAIGGELSKVLPTSAAAPMDTATRKLVGDNVLRMSQLLEKLQ